MDMTFAEKIRILINRSGMSLSGVADKTGQSRQNLSNKMKRNNFSESEIEELAEALGYTVEVHFLDADGNVVL